MSDPLIDPDAFGRDPVQDAEMVNEAINQVREETDEISKRNAVGHMEHLVNDQCDHDNCEQLRNELGIKDQSSEGESGGIVGSSGDGSDGSDEAASIDEGGGTSDEDESQWPPDAWRD